MAAVPAVLMLAVAGMEWTARRLVRQLGSISSGIVVVGIALVGFFLEAFTVPTKAWGGFGPVAAQLMARSELKDAVFLVGSDARGEGMFVSEVAMRELRPGHFVLRASKVLASSRWDGSEYEVLYRDVNEVESFLEETGVGVVVLDCSSPESRRHLKLLGETLAAFPVTWEFLGSHRVTRDGVETERGILVYGSRTVGVQRRRPIEGDIRRMLNWRIGS